MMYSKRKFEYHKKTTTEIKNNGLSLHFKWFFFDLYG